MGRGSLGTRLWLDFKMAFLIRRVREVGGIRNAFSILMRQDNKLYYCMCTEFYVMCSCFVFRTRDVRAGTLVGEDKYGNKYYENLEYFFGM